jgi:hypothetical protein
MKILLADVKLLFCGQVRNKRIAWRGNDSGLSVFVGASHG